MFRKPEDSPQTKLPINVLIAENGCGDLLCALVATNYLVTKCPWLNPLIWVPTYLEEFTKHVLPKESIVRDFIKASKKYDPKKYGVTTKWSNITPMKMHPIKYAYAVLCDYEPTMEEMSYLKIRPDEIDVSKFNLPEKYVVLPAAATEKVKTIPKETMDQISDYVVSKGYTPVYLGKTENYTGFENMYGRSVAQDYDFSKGINLLEKTSLLESAVIISKAKAFIGIDSGLTHLAGFTETTIVSYYSFTSPRQMLPIRDGIFGKNVYAIEPNERLGCRGCQSNMVSIDWDFRKCFYDDYACVSIEECSAKKFIDMIEKNNLL